MEAKNSIRSTDKREKKRQKLVDAAEQLISQGGLGRLKARDVAAHVGIALGQIYNLVGDMDELVLHVNSRTIARLESLLEKRLVSPPLSSAPAQEKLIAVAIAYHHFARENYHLWHALFDHQPEHFRAKSGTPVLRRKMREDKELEQFLKSVKRFSDKNCGKNKEPPHEKLVRWVSDERLRPFRLIEQLLAPLCTTLSVPELKIFAQSVFSGVHGIILLALDARDVGVPEAQLDAQLRLHLTLLCRGLADYKGSQ